MANADLLQPALDLHSSAQIQALSVSFFFFVKRQSAVALNCHKKAVTDLLSRRTFLSRSDLVSIRDTFLAPRPLNLEPLFYVLSPLSPSTSAPAAFYCSRSLVYPEGVAARSFIRRSCGYDSHPSSFPHSSPLTLYSCLGYSLTQSSDSRCFVYVILLDF